MSGVIVNEWIETVGGAERVLDGFASTFPDARIIAPWNDATGRFGSGRVIESWMSATPLRKHKALSVPFMLDYWRNLPDLDAEWMLCSSHVFAHHAVLGGRIGEVPKFVFAHSPARYLWEPGLDARGAGLIARAAAIPLRAIDRRRAQEADRIAAVSSFIAERIEKCWGRESTVINPPVDVDVFLADDSGL